MDCLKNISNDDVIKAIQNAACRIVFLAPGIDEATAAALKVAWQQLGPEAVTVILDIDAEVIRLGYGTEVGLDEIQKAAMTMNQAVGHQPGVRICVVIADETSLIFTPTPLLVEAGSKQPERPNGIRLHTPPRTLCEELGIGDEGSANRTIGLEVVKAETVAAVKKDLLENPALKYDISRKERVFNARLEFVEFELEGCMISQHTVTLPPHLVGMAKMDEKTRGKLRSSFRLIAKDEIVDSKKKISEQALRDECLRIRRKFLRPIKGFGTLILRANKAAFEAEVKTLRGKVTAFSTALGEKLIGLYDENAKRLTKALLPAIARHPPEEWVGALGLHPEREVIEKMLHRALLHAFGEPEALLREMRVNLNFKGVTYGTLTDEKFVAATKTEFPDQKLHEEYDAARGNSSPPPSPPVPPATQPGLFEP